MLHVGGEAVGDLLQALKISNFPQEPADTDQSCCRRLLNISRGEQQEKLTLMSPLLFWVANQRSCHLVAKHDNPRGSMYPSRTNNSGRDA